MDCAVSDFGCPGTVPSLTWVVLTRHQLNNKCKTSHSSLKHKYLQIQFALHTKAYLDNIVNRYCVSMMHIVASAEGRYKALVLNASKFVMTALSSLLQNSRFIMFIQLTGKIPCITHFLNVCLVWGRTFRPFLISWDKRQGHNLCLFVSLFEKRQKNANFFPRKLIMSVS